MKEVFEKLVRHFGTQTQAAKRLGGPDDHIRLGARCAWHVAGCRAPC